MFFADFKFVINLRLRAVTLNNLVVSLKHPQLITSLRFTSLPRSLVGLIIGGHILWVPFLGFEVFPAFICQIFAL